MTKHLATHFSIETDELDLRLDRLLIKRFPTYSRSYFQYLIENQSVTINGQKVKKREKPKFGDRVEVFFIPPPEMDISPEDIPLEILYEDEHLICINKAAGMVVHPAPGNPDRTFVNALLYHCSTLQKMENDPRPGIVHRLDKDTSGVLLAAKTLLSHQKLVELFAARKMDKTYLAITLGNPGEISIKAPIGRNPYKRKEMSVVIEEGKEAITFVKPLASNQIFSLVEVKPKTGRTHQIRVHLKSVKTPILGDTVYGCDRTNSKYNVARQLLHALSISFIHPFTGELLHLSAPIPNDMEEWISKIGSKEPKNR